MIKKFKKTYTKEEVLDIITKTYWEGVDEGQTSSEYAGDGFSAEVFLEEIYNEIRP